MQLESMVSIITKLSNEEVRGPSVSAFKQVVKERKYRWGFGDTVTWPTSEMGPVKINICPAELTSFLFWGETKERGKILAEVPSWKWPVEDTSGFPHQQSFGSALISAAAVVESFVWAEPPCRQHCIWNKSWLQLFALEPCLKPQEAAQPSSKMVTLNTQGGTAGGQLGYFFGKLLDMILWVFSPGLLIFPEDYLLLSCHLVANVGRRQSSPYWIHVYIISCFPLGNQPRWLQKIFMSS